MRAMRDVGDKESSLRIPQKSLVKVLHRRNPTRARPRVSRAPIHGEFRPKSKKPICAAARSSDQVQYKRLANAVKTSDRPFSGCRSCVRQRLPPRRPASRIDPTSARLAVSTSREKIDDSRRKAKLRAYPETTRQRRRADNQPDAKSNDETYGTKSTEV